MAIKQTSGAGNGVFYNINAKEGCFQTGSGETKRQYEPGSAEIDGIVIAMSVKENAYEGKMKEELRLTVKDTVPGQPLQYISFGITGPGSETEAGDATALGLRIMGKLLAADLSKPVAFKPWFAAKGTKLGNSLAESDLVGVKMSQNGQSLKEDFGNGLSDLPKIQVQLNSSGKPIMSNGQPVYDKGPWTELMDEVLVSLEEKIKAAHGQQEQTAEGVDMDEAASAVSAASYRPQG